MSVCEVAFFCVKRDAYNIGPIADTAHGVLGCAGDGAEQHN
jgi:hypothetical protein